jgi:hypothetical protein
VNPILLVWISSLGGAALFFAAGALAGRRRAYAGPLPVADVAVPRVDLAPPKVEEAPVLRAEATGLNNQVAEMQNEAARLHQALADAEERLKLREGELQRFRRALEEVQKRSVDEAGRWQAERAELAERAARIPHLEGELEQRRLEISRWRQELRDAEGQLSRSPSADIEQTLRQDLAIKVQLLRANEQRMVRLEEDNARLRQEASASSGLREERDRLRTENAQLRARAFAAPPTSLPAAVAPAPRGAGRGHLFQSFVDQVSRLADIRCAVVADELGLVVASHGTLGDEVAAVGSLLSRAGGKALEVLPLRNLHRVTVEDDQRVALTLRPLPTREGKDSDLALITLAVGVAPDPHVLTKLINEGPRNILS